MKNHTKLTYAQDFFRDPSGSFGAGFNRRVLGDSYSECFKYDNERTNGALHNGWNAAEKLIEEGKAYYRHNFHRSHGGCLEGFAFQYGGKWVCNTCYSEGLERTWWDIKITKDGDMFCCVGPEFENLQASENYAFGKTKAEAIKSYGDLMTQLKATQ